MHDPIQFLWVGPSLSRLEQLSLASFVYHGHDVHLYTYEDVQGIPDGVTVKDGQDVLPESMIFRQKHGDAGKGSVANFADQFRWELLLKRGGYWADTDIVCMKPFDFEDEIVFGKEAENVANIAILKFPPGHRLSQLICDVFEKPFANYRWDTKRDKKRKLIKKLTGRATHEHIRFADLGPRLFTAVLRDMKMLDMGKPFTHFYPIHWDNWESIFDETFRHDDELFADTYALHFWNEMTRRRPGFDKNQDFPKDSLIEKLRRKYGA